MWASQAIGKQKTTEEALQNRIETAKIILEKDPSVVDIQTYVGNIAWCRPNVCNIGVDLMMLPVLTSIHNYYYRNNGLL